MDLKSRMIAEVGRRRNGRERLCYSVEMGSVCSKRKEIGIKKKYVLLTPGCICNRSDTNIC